MTKEQFEQAKMLEQRFQSVSKLIECCFNDEPEYTLDPPTRMSGISVVKGSHVHFLNEAEAMVFLNALVEERSRLREEFERL